MVKFYQLWSAVKGTRIDTRSTDPDIQCNAFVEDNKLYLILNNLYFNDANVQLNMVEHHANAIQNIKVKHLYLNGDTPVLEEENYANLEIVTIGAEGSMVIEYTFENEVIIDELVEESKYFADTYLTPITPFTDHTFHINDVNKGEQGEAVLRLGMGRPHGRSLQPTVKVNGFEVQVPSNYAGYDQAPKSSWFGVIEVPVPFYYLQEDNEITVRFEDTQGHISTMALRVYNHSNSLFRSDSVQVASLTLLPTHKFMLPDTDFQLITEITPLNATDPTLTFTSSAENVATVDDFGKVTAHNFGTTTITAIATSNGLMANSTIEVVDSIPFVSVFGIDLQPQILSIEPNETFPIQAIINPIDATNDSVTWETGNALIATVDENGVVKGKLEGTTQIIATTVDGGFTDTSHVTVIANYATNVFCSLLPDQLDSDTLYDISFSYSSGFNVDVIVELQDANGNVLGQGQTTGTPSFSNIANIQLTTAEAPPSGDTYSFYVFLNAAGIDSTLFSCILENVSIMTVGTNAIEFSNLKLYPNPTNGELHLEVPYLKNEILARVFDIMGRQVYEQVIQGTNNRLDLSGLPSGVFLVRIGTAEESVVQRIVLK